MFEPARQIDLAFSDWKPLRHVEDPLHKDLSAVARMGNCLFVACDETSSVERLQRIDEGRYGHHAHFDLGTIIDLPAGPDGEMDIEGMAASDGYLWVMGSHSLKRSKPKREGNNAADALIRMGNVEREPNRSFLGRIPLEEEAPGVFRPCVEVDGRRAAMVRMTSGGSRLLGWLRRDPLLSSFVEIPSKENGLDLEGIAVKDERVWLGLRGPVLRGHAVVLDLAMKERKDSLKARRIDGALRYRKHLLDTHGLGIRDLRLDGDDLLLLVGPTMSLAGPAYVLRWRDAVHDDASGVIDPKRIERVCDLPYRQDVDHPEGLELWPEAGPGALLVLYDAPAPERMSKGPFNVLADVIQP